METFFLVHVRRKRRDCFYIYIKILKKDARRHDEGVWGLHYFGNYLIGSPQWVPVDIRTPSSRHILSNLKSRGLEIFQNKLSRKCQGYLVDTTGELPYCVRFIFHSATYASGLPKCIEIVCATVCVINLPGCT